VAVLPTGALEAHGPHLPLATDVVIAEAMARDGARRLAERGFEVLLLPAIPYAPAPFAAAFPGTVEIPAEAVTQMVASVARSLGTHGIQTLVVANAHHDPAQVQALRSAVSAESLGTRVLFPDVTRRRIAARLGDEFVSGACHAGRYEGAIVLAERPAWVRTEVMRRLPANPHSLSDAIRDGRRTFDEAGGPEAYFGFPAEATADEGRTLVAALGEMLAEAVLEALT
jgi:creatinine amidohydrolase